jgi:hypothetical protein
MLESLGLLLVVGLAVTILWSPVLLVGRLRSLFRRLPPTGSTLGSYLLVAVGLSVPFHVGSGIVFATTSTEGAALSNALLNVTLALAVSYVIVLPLVAGVGLPRIGIDWDSTGYGASTWATLVGSTLMYVTVFVLPLSFLAFVLALPTG